MTSKDTGLRVIIYCRISRDWEGEALGVERQKEDCLARAKREGWKVVDVLLENDVSAAGHKKKARPLYDSLFQRARNGETDIILAYSNSRLTRRPKELEDLIELHEHTGVRICTIVSGDDDLSTADGRMVARIKANVDAAEAERVSERVRRKQQQRIAQGLSAAGGVRPFGYAADRVTVVEEEAEAIRQAARNILEHGASASSQARAWNEAGIRTVNGNEWTVNTITKVLKSPRIAGFVSHKGEIKGKAAWEPILEADVWERLHHALGNGKTGEGKRQQHLLTGMLFCAECGTSMAAGGQNGAYRCNRGRKGCGKVSARFEAIEGHVVSEWVKHVTEKTGSDFFEAEISVAGDQQELMILEGEREEINRRIETVRRNYALGRIGDDDFFPVIEMLRSRLGEIDTEISLKQRPHQFEGKTITSVVGKVPWRTAFDLLGEQDGTVVQREYLSRFIEKIKVSSTLVRGRARFDTDRVRITWRD